MYTIYLGQTEVKVTSRRIVVSHFGNMGAKIDDVRDNFDRKFGQGSFSKFLAIAEVKGAPDYALTATAPYKLAKDIIGEA